MEARPTEFRGITYRSKCEAMFALWLELRSPSAVVEYEPSWCELGDYTVDFVVAKPQESSLNGRLVMFDTWLEFIEYKPSRPTFTYIAEIAKKLRMVAARETAGTDLKFGCFIYWGSVYSEERGIYAIDGDRGFYECSGDTNWLGVHERAVRDFRFDLEATPC